MSEVNTDMWAQELVRLLHDMSQMHGELAMHLRNKLDAMRRAATDEVQSITARETLLAERLVERDGLRRQITRKCLEGLGLDPKQHERMRLSDLAERFDEPRRSQLLVVAAGLREQVEEVERLQVKAKVVTQMVLKHMEKIFEAMTAGIGGTDGYSRRGAREQSQRTTVFEAVG